MQFSDFGPQMNLRMRDVEYTISMCYGEIIFREKSNWVWCTAPQGVLVGSVESNG